MEDTEPTEVESAAICGFGSSLGRFQRVDPEENDLEPLHEPKDVHYHGGDLSV